MSMIPIVCPLLGSEEQEAVLRVFASGQLAQREHVAAFERRFAEVCHLREAVATSSRTAALHLALLAPGIASCDEEVLSSFSFVANADIILLVGVTPLIVDIEPDTYPLDPSLVESALIPHSNSTKNITTGEGGIVTTNDPEITQHVRLLGSHEQKECYYSGCNRASKYISIFR